MKISPLNNKNVLVVDDEIEIRKALIFDLKRRGCNIFEAANGTDAIEIVKKNPIDIVVTDVRMPNGDGVDLLKQIRAYNPKIPIVLLATGFADLSESEAVGMGAYGIIEKPFNRQKMLSLLEDFCLQL
ncbi:MAG: response regulator [Bdellovibrionota bacterium]